MLDLAGHTPDENLASLVALEPSAGKGAFLGPMMERLGTFSRNPTVYGCATEFVENNGRRRLDIDEELRLAVQSYWTGRRRIGQNKSGGAEEMPEPGER